MKMMNIAYLDSVLELDNLESIMLKRAKKIGLVESIKENGVLEPIRVDIKKGCFENGQHRFVASKYLRLKEIPVFSTKEKGDLKKKV